MLLLGALGVLAGCDGTADTGPSGTAGLREPTGSPRPVVFESGQLIWAQRSSIHVGDRTYDVSPQLVQSMDWTPYGLYLRVTTHPDDGPFHEVFFDGSTIEQVPDVYDGPITSPDGLLEAWVDRTGPERPAGQVAQVVVVDTATGEQVFEDAEGMGGEEGDDLGDLYEELPPAVVDLTHDRLVWRNTVGNFPTVSTDLTTGTTTDREPRMRPLSGYTYWSPDGRYRVHVRGTGRLEVRPRQPDFGHRWVFSGGWLDDHTMLVLAQDRYRFVDDLRVPDTTPGHLLACDLDRGTCERVGHVIGAGDVVFPGVDLPD